MDGSGANVTLVPVFDSGESPISWIGPTGCPPSRKSCLHRRPSRSISNSTATDKALTTDTPTPCKPPETLYPPPPNFPPACNTVITTSAADLPGYFGCSPTGIPRPSSTTRHRPSARMTIWIVVQCPAIASSTELSTTSYTR